MAVTRNDFPEHGFLSWAVEAGINDFRTENAKWFDLLRDVNSGLMAIVEKAATEATGTSWTAQTVATRILMRSTGNLQGVVLLAEREMTVQARTLVRGIIEDSFWAAALSKEPEKVLDRIRQDSETSRRNQVKFIVKGGIQLDATQIEELKSVLDGMDKRATLISIRELAEIGELLPQYLAYLRLSDDSAHTSARSLDKHVAPVTRQRKRVGWNYQMGPSGGAENAATCHWAIVSSLATGIAVTQILQDNENNSKLGGLAERFKAMPKTIII